MASAACFCLPAALRTYVSVVVCVKNVIRSGEREVPVFKHPPLYLLEAMLIHAEAYAKGQTLIRPLFSRPPV